MVRVLVLYTKPQDELAFEKHYQEVHLPLAKRLPGLQRFTVSRNVVPTNESEPYYLIAELDWIDTAALQEAFQSSEGRAVGQDIAEHLAKLSPGMRSMFYDVNEV
jgi:uncharacterized protein (TIGR02118 family)